MANNVTITDYNGDAVVMATLDVSGVHYTKHLQLPSVTVQRAIIDISTMGDNEIIAAPTGGKKIKVLGLFLVPDSAVTMAIQSGAGGTNLTGDMLLANAPLVLPTAMQGYHYLETAVDTALSIALSAAVQVSGSIIYYEE